MIVLLSGGVDSIATWRLLGLPPAVSFDIGTASAAKERKATQWAAGHFKASYLERRIPMGSAEKANGWLPFRNTLLALSAAQMDSTVVLSAVAEWAPDKNVRWARSLERTVNRGGKAATATERLRIEMPYARLSKGELLFLYHQTYGAEEARLLLLNAWSCYLSLPNPCLKCGGCRQRIAAEHQYALLSGTPAPSYTAARWEIPIVDRLRWIRDNRILGVQQIIAHSRQDDCLPVG
jgi:7-cyano-7-deazaguanine synthase in queuosine biosynthesis